MHEGENSIFAVIVGLFKATEMVLLLIAKP
jgi:hypothetical protein